MGSWFLVYELNTWAMKMFLLVLLQIVPTLFLGCQLTEATYCFRRFKMPEERPFNDNEQACNGLCRTDEEYSFNHYPIFDPNSEEACLKCQSGQTCPYCSEKEYWCKESEACHRWDIPCNSTCPSHVYPIFQDGTCLTCDQHLGTARSQGPPGTSKNESLQCSNRVFDYDLEDYVCSAWCQQEKKCIKVAMDDGGADPCGERCFTGKPKDSNFGENLLCPSTNKCNIETLPCGEDCLDKYRYYCSSEKACLWKSQACKGQCPPGRRYCPRYKIDDFIGDGKGSCIRSDQPCGGQCVEGRTYCMASQSCLSKGYEGDCPCPRNMWPMRTACGVAKCSLRADQPLKSEFRSCMVPVDEGKSTRVYFGDCHPDYVFCPSTNKCEPLLYTSCGYESWLKGFQIRACTETNPNHGIVTCVESVLNLTSRLWKSQASKGQCPPGRRYCPRYRIDDFIGDGKGSCIESHQPCGGQCEGGRTY